MKKTTKKLAVAVLAGAVFATGSIDFFAVQAAPVEASGRMAAAAGPCRPGRGPLNAEQAAKHLAAAFGLDETEIQTALQEQQIDMRDAGRAAMLAKASGKSFADVLAMKTKENSWPEVASALGVTRENVRTVMEQMMADRLESRAGIDKTVTARLLKEGYHPRDIEAAGLIARLSSQDIQKVLDQKKINNTWQDVARSLGLKEDALKTAMHPEEGAGMGSMGMTFGGPSELIWPDVSPADPEA